MGQFASRAFDGDPYIDIMRALPDKELVWWVQKVIWLAEGMTILEHFGRTYPELFVHKCAHCNGAGIVTCPHCNGYKVRRAHAHAFRLSEHTSVGRLLAAADMKECEHCGVYCPWDNESEWQEEWNQWQQRLAYYDRTHGELYNEWYEDVINEGRLDEDTAPEEEPMPGPNDKSLDSYVSKQVSKDKQRLKALMRRVGGHPYEHSHMVPYPVIDPYKSLEDNMDAIGFHNFDLPPELHPEKFPELLLEGPNGALQNLDREIKAEYLIMQNLDAALRDAPKPALFQPSAGTVACPACRGQAWFSDWVPNLQRLLRAEQPFWARTFARMSPYWAAYGESDASPSYSPWHSAAAAADAAASAAASGSGRGSGGGADGAGGRAEAAAALRLGRQSRQAAGSRAPLLGEVPSQPPLLTPAQVAEAGAALAGRRGMPVVPDELVDGTDARRMDGGVDYGRLAAVLGASLPSSPVYIQEFGRRLVPEAADVRRAASALLPEGSRLAEGVLGGGTSGYGPLDPLSLNPQEAWAPDALQKQALAAPGGPLLGDSVLRAQLLAAEAANPARAAARRLRDARQLGALSKELPWGAAAAEGKAERPEEQELVLKWAQQQPSLQPAQP